MNKNEVNNKEETLKIMSKYFDKPLYEAAACLGLSLTDLKQLCRDVDLKRWPYHGLKKHNIKQRKENDPFQVLGSFVIIKPNSPTNISKKKQTSKPNSPNLLLKKNKNVETTTRMLPSFQSLVESINTAEYPNYYQK